MHNFYPYLLINGRARKKAALPGLLTDAGFLYGYGLFETILIKNSQPVLFSRHWERMKKGARFFQIAFPFNKRKFYNALLKLIAKNNCARGRLNLYLTAGEKSADLGVPYPRPNWLAVIRPINENIFDASLEIEFKKDPFPRSKLDNFKSLAIVKNIFARKNLPPGADIVFYNQKKEIQEATFSNVFFIKNKILITPNSRYILPGVTRDLIIKNAEKLGFKIEKRRVKFAELSSFEEIFLTNAIQGIIRVHKTADFPKLKSGKKTTQISRKLFFL